MILVKDNNGKIHQTTDGTNAIVPSLNVTQEVLWTNPNQNQNFVAQSINTSSPMTDFDYIMMTYYDVIDRKTLLSTIIPTGVDFSLEQIYANNGGSFHSYREVKYTNSTTLAIQDAYDGSSTVRAGNCLPVQLIGFKFLDTLNYSTEEQYTGKHWIDGKKIYQKTFHFTNTKSGQYTQNLPNFGQLISLEGSINSPATSWVPITYSNPGNVSNYTATAFVENITETSIVLNLSMGSGLGTPANIYVTLRYTKTTE